MKRTTRVLMTSAVAVLLGPALLLAQFPSEQLGFNGDPGANPPQTINDPATSHEMFQRPDYSGSTREYIVPNAAPDTYENNGAFRAAGLQSEGVAAMQVFFTWDDPLDQDAWVRLTTFRGELWPNPALDTQGKVRFQFQNQGQIVFPFEEGAIGLCIGIRETGNDVAQLADGGETGTIEWVGVDTSLSIIQAGSNGVLDSLPAGDDVINTNGAPNINWGPNQVLDTTPAGDDVAEFGYIIGTNGVRTPIPAIIVPAFEFSGMWIEWDLSTGVVSTGATLGSLTPQGGGIAAFTGNGVLDAPNDRGTLEHIALVNVADDGWDDMVMAIDSLQFEATVPDPVSPPRIITPVSEGAIQVQVQATVGATQTTLFVNGMDPTMATPNGTTGVSTHNVPMLMAGDVLTATQTKDGLTSGLSNPVIVFAAGVLVADNFDSYTTQAELNDYWFDSIASPSPADAKLLLAQGSAASCPNIIKEDNPAGANAARLYQNLPGGTNGTNDDPLWVTWYYRFTGSSGANSRTRFELARFDEGSFNVGPRDEGSAGITVFNAPVGDPNIPDFQSQFNLTVISTNGLLVPTNGFYDAGGWKRALSGVVKEPDRWYKMQIRVDTDYINWYIDDVLVTPEAFRPGGALGLDGIPRSNVLDYSSIIIGEGFSNNNNTVMLFDNVSVTVGDTPLPFGPPVSTPSPTVQDGILPGVNTADLLDVETNASQVTVYLDGVSRGTAAGPFPSGAASVMLSQNTGNGTEVTATQTVGGVQSCISAAVITGVPAVTVDAPVVPTQPTVDVSGLEEGVASLVTVYRNELEIIGTLASPATDPATVTLNGGVTLLDGDLITASQTINGFEGPQSAAVTVGVPRPTVAPGLLPFETTVTVLNVHPLATSVTVFVNDAPTVEPVSNVTMVDVDVAALMEGDEVRATQTIGGTESPSSLSVFVEAPQTPCGVAFSDNFNTNTAANWIVNQSSDTAITFNYNYAADGIPPSPNGGGNTQGVKFEANLSTGTVNGITIAPVGQTFGGDYILRFDMWINANGPFPLGGGGSTEFLTAGLGYDGATVNLGGTSGSGGWFTVSGEGGSSRDWRAYKNAGEQFAESGQFFAGTSSAGGGAHNASDPYYAQFGNVDVTVAVPQQSANHPQQTGVTGAGAPAFGWHEVEIVRVANTVTWSVDGLPIAQLDTTVGSSFPTTGNISLGYMDIFTSVSDNAALSFGLIDNVVVEGFPGGDCNGNGVGDGCETIAGGDWDVDGDVDIDDYAALADCLSGPGASPAPTNELCADACLAAFDYDVDGDIDLNDFQEFQEGFGM